MDLFALTYVEAQSTYVKVTDYFVAMYVRTYTFSCSSTTIMLAKQPKTWQ